jgi:hypothetical protein
MISAASASLAPPINDRWLKENFDMLKREMAQHRYGMNQHYCIWLLLFDAIYTVFIVGISHSGLCCVVL